MPCFSDNISVGGNITGVALALVCTILQGLSPPITGVVCTVEECMRGGERGGELWARLCEPIVNRHVGRPGAELG